MERIGIELEEAVGLIEQYICPVTDMEYAAVEDADGRILAEDVYADMDQPPFPRSPLDGFAFRSCDVRDASEAAPAVLEVSQIIYAGDWWKESIGPGQAARIMTGAPIPEGADCVIRQEETSWAEDGSTVDDCIGYRVRIPHPMKEYQNYCFQGEDVTKGTLLLAKGCRIGYVEQGILASSGCRQVLVYKRPRVSLFVTGDELWSGDGPLPPGKIYDANMHLLAGRLGELGYGPVTARMLGDEPELVAEEIRRALEGSELIVTCGGVSVGDKDIFHQVLPILGAERIFWRVRVKPGTPVMFAMCGRTPMIHLSGNPFAALATFELFVRPALYKLTGDERVRLSYVKAVLAEGFPKKGGRRMLRARLEGQQVHIPPTGQHSSGMLHSMRGCNCLIDLPPSKEPVQAGQQVKVILL